MDTPKWLTGSITDALTLLLPRLPGAQPNLVGILDCSGALTLAEVGQNPSDLPAAPRPGRPSQASRLLVGPHPLPLRRQRA